MNPDEPVGWGLVRKSLPEMGLYVLFILFLVLVRPPIYVVAGVVTIYILIKMVVAVRFTWPRFLKACVVVYLVLGALYAVKHFIGGVWALVIAHVAGITLIIISRWRFIKKCDAQIKKQMDVIIKKGGKK